MNRSTPGLPVHHQLLEFTQTHVHPVMPSSHLILCRPLLLLPPILPSIRVFSNESTLCMRWPKYWSFSFSIIPSNEIPGLISFTMDWLDLLAVQGTLIHINNYFKSSWTKCSNQKTKSDWMDTRTRPIYIYIYIYTAYKRLTSDLKTHTDWKAGDVKRYSMQMETKATWSSNIR